MSCIVLVRLYWCYVVAGVVWCGIRMEDEALVLQHTTPAKPQRNANTHRTRAIQPMKELNKQVASF